MVVPHMQQQRIAAATGNNPMVSWRYGLEQPTAYRNSKAKAIVAKYIGCTEL